jgi:sarcosine oxidase subunit gamma
MAYSVEIRPEPAGTLYDVRGAADIVGAPLRALRLELPARANTRSAAGELELLWVGAQRWLLRSRVGSALAAQLSALDREPDASVVEVTDAYAFFALVGTEAGEVVAQASPLDVHPSAFPANGATFTEFFGQAALVVRRDDGFLVGVEASHGDFIAAFLAQARG